MSVVFSGTTQGVFTSTGANTVIQVPEGVDYIRVYNQTQMAANAVSTGYEFYWQLGMAPGAGWEYQSNSGGTAINIIPITAGSGFTPINSTVNTYGAPVNITSISTATTPVVTASNTGLTAFSSIVRLYNTNSAAGALQLGGMDFTVGTLTSTTAFTLAYMSTLPVGSTGGQYRIVPYKSYFYPPVRIISAIASSTLNGANVAIVTLTVTHAFTVGQSVRFLIPTVTAAAFGMPQLNQVEATILAVGAAGFNGVTNTITVNVDVSTFGTFAWPLSANGAFTPAQVVPVGEQTSQALTSGVYEYGDAEVNNGYLGIQLGGGKDAPAGQSGDVVYWVAGKSFNGS